MHVKYSGSSPRSETGTPPSSSLQRTKTKGIFWYLGFNLFFFFVFSSESMAIKTWHENIPEQELSLRNLKASGQRFHNCDALYPCVVWSSHCWVSLIKKKATSAQIWKKIPQTHLFFGSVQLHDVSLNSLSVVYSAKGLFCVLAERSALRMWTKAMLLLTWG